MFDNSTTNSNIILHLQKLLKFIWFSDAIQCQRSCSTPVQVMEVMDFCMAALSHYLNQCWLTTDEVLRHSHQEGLNIQFNLLRPSGAIRPPWSVSTLVQVMVCYMTTSSHYLKQSWFHISEGFTLEQFYQGSVLYNDFENHIFKITATFPKGQWVKMTVTHRS